MAQSFSNKLVICRLEENLRIVMKGEVYILQERIYDEKCEGNYRWKDKFYNSWIGGILRSYVLYSLQRFAFTDLSGSVKHLINQIEKLNTTITQADTNITELQKEHEIDPVELAILKDRATDAIEQIIDNAC